MLQEVHKVPITPWALKSPNANKRLQEEKSALGK